MLLQQTIQKINKTEFIIKEIDMGNFRFGIMGAAKIANKFCEAVSLLDNCEVCAISSKSFDRAKGLADKYEFAGIYCIKTDKLKTL